MPLQQMLHRSWSSEDGLPVGGVFQIARTPDGYVWLSSNSGLIRFDGLRFTLLDSTVVPLLGRNGIQDVGIEAFAPDGTLWLLASGASLITYRDGAFTLYATVDSASRPLRSMTEDRTGRRWQTGGREWRLWQWQGGKEVSPHLAPAMPDTGIQGVIPDLEKGIWAGSRTQGLWHLTDSSASQYMPRCQRFSALRPLLQARDGKVWVSSCQGLAYLEKGEWHTVAGLKGRFVQPTRMLESAQGELWIATRGSGLLRIVNGELEQFTEVDGLSDAVVHNIALDGSGGVWVTTDGGLDRLRPAPAVTLTRRAAIPFDSPLAIVQASDSSIWAMAYDERQTFHLDGGIIRRVSTPIRTLGVIGSAVRPSPVAATGADGGVWSRFEFSIGRYDAAGRLRLSQSLEPARDIYHAANPGDRLWLALLPSGLAQVKDGVLRHVALPQMSEASSVTIIAPTPARRVWIVASRPLRIYQLEGDSVVRQLDAARLQGNPLRTLAAAGEDTAYGVQARRTLVRIIGDSLGIMPIPELGPILSSASDLTLLQGEYLWFASEGGIARIARRDLDRRMDGDTAQLSVRWFSQLDGFASAKMTTLNRLPGFAGYDGRLWFSTPAGITVVDPEMIRPDTVPPVPHVESMTVDGRRVPVMEPVTIGPGPGRLEIRYSATGPAIPERIALEYMLEGADRSWIRSGPDRVVAYGQLRPGNYTFRVRAINGDGVPSRADAVLAVSITPTWYQTRAFLALLLLMVAAGGAAVVYAIQRARVRTANERMQARYDATLSERTRLARELHDTLLQGFTGITLQLQALQRMITTSPRDAAINLSQVLSTADATLRDARQMVWDMRAPELDHHDLAEALETAARQAIADTGIRLDFTYSGTRRRLDIGVETTVLRIGREAVVNAVKHAAPVSIAVSVHFAQSQVTLLVRDDGRGCDDAMLEAAVQGGHWGIRGMQERATRAGGTLEITGGPGRGTVIHLTVPLSA